jgi:opacity protein-like surface antigen
VDAADRHRYQLAVTYAHLRNEDTNVPEGAGVRFARSFNRFVHIFLDGSYHRDGAGADKLYALGGVGIHLRTSGTLRPYVQILAGMTQFDGQERSRGLAAGLGAGLDLRVASGLRLRLAQLDYLQDRFARGSTYDLRYSAGLAFEGGSMRRGVAERQDVDRRHATEVALSYAYLRDEEGRGWSEGASVELAHALNRVFSVLGDVSLHLLEGDRTYLLGGARLNSGRRRRVTLFGHGLGGLVAANLEDESTRGWAVGGGGGLEVNLGSRFSVRLAQVDYLTNFLEDEVETHDVRFHAGLVFR